MGNKSSSLQLAQTEQLKPATDNVFLLHSNHYNARQRLTSRSQSLPTNSLRVLSFQYNTWTDEGIPIHPEDFQNRRHSTVSYIPHTHRNRVIPIDLRPQALLSQSSNSTSTTNSPRSGLSSARSTTHSSPRYSPRSNNYSPKLQQAHSDSSSPRPHYTYDEDNSEEVANLTAFRLTSSKYNDYDNEEDSNVINTTHAYINPLNHHQFHQHHVNNTQPPPQTTTHVSPTSSSNISSLPPLDKPNLRAHPKRIMVTPLTQLYTRTSNGTNSGTPVSNTVPTSILGKTGSASNLILGSPIKPSMPSTNSNAQSQLRRYSLSAYTLKRKSSISSSSSSTPPTNHSNIEEHVSSSTVTVADQSSTGVVSSSTTTASSTAAVNASSMNASSNSSSPTKDKSISNQNFDVPTPPLTPKSKPRERSGSVTKILIQSPARLNPIALFSESHKRKQPPTVAVTTPDEPPCFDHLLNPPQETIPKKLKTKRSYSLPSNSPKSPSKGRKNKRF